MFGRNKNKIKAIFLIPLGKENYKKVGEKKIEIGKDATVNYHEKSFIITVKSYSYIDKKEPKVFIDVENEKILIFNKKSIGIDAKFLDKFLTTSKVGIIGQLFHALKMQEQQRTDWGLLAKPVIIFVLGAVIGYFVGSGS